jgi:hypothetical protein
MGDLLAVCIARTADVDRCGGALGERDNRCSPGRSGQMLTAGDVALIVEPRAARERATRPHAARWGPDGRSGVHGLFGAPVKRVRPVFLSALVGAGLRTVANVRSDSCLSNLADDQGFARS